MNTPTATRPTVRLFAKRPKDRRWKLVGEYPTREAAWNAITVVPKGFAVWLNDRPRPKKADPRPAGRRADRLTGPRGTRPDH